MRGIFHVLTNHISDQLARSIAEQKENTNKLVKAIADLTGVVRTVPVIAPLIQHRCVLQRTERALA
jgi:hypothetical protein